MKPTPHYIPTLAERYPLAFAAGVMDLLLIIVGCHGAFWLRFGSWHMPDRYLLATLVLAISVIACQFALGTYLSWRGWHMLRQLGRMCSGWLLALACVTVLAVLLQMANAYSRAWMLSSVAISFLLIALFRLSIYMLLRSLRGRGRNLKHVVVVEANNAAAALHTLMPQLPQLGYKVTRTLRLDNSGEWDTRLIEAIAADGAHELWLCLPLQEGNAIRHIMHTMRHQTVDIRYLPDLGDLPLLNHRVSNIGGLYALDISRSPMEGPARLLKRIEDLALGLPITLMILPVCLAIAIAIKLTSPGPIIFKQYRTGINGKRFKVYKFRSMEIHTEHTGQVTQACFDDPRITRLGAFLRRTSLDELPQFINVLQGRMSIVGPRPHALAHNEHYKDMVESYMQRHKVKPGITGWAQVNGHRGATDTLDKMARRVEHDLWYIDNWSLWLDLRIIFMTIYKGFFNRQP